MSKYSCLVDNRAGDIYDIPFIKVKISSKYNGEPTKCEFSYLRGCGATIEVGSVVRFSLDGKAMFYGYVTDIKTTQKEDVQCTAYDQMFYLRYQDTYTIKQKTATQIVSMICGDVGLKIGALEDTRYVLDLLAENKKLCEIIQDALDRTVAQMQKWYIIYDNAGQIKLSAFDDMKLDLIVGELALATAYDYGQSISDDTYNQIKLVKKDEDTGAREIHIFKNSDTMQRWGTLQYYATVDEGLTDGAIKEKGEMLLKTKNRILRKLSIDALGDPSVRGGSVLFVNLPSIDIATWFVVSEANHTIENQSHTMKLTLHMPNIQEGA